jgi:hypothetical protein
MAISFANDIRPLFRTSDVSTMKDISGLDLSKYEDVKQHANDIFHRTKEGDMPCDGPWPAANIEKFKQWMDGGMLP